MVLNGLAAIYLLVCQKIFSYFLRLFSFSLPSWIQATPLISRNLTGQIVIVTGANAGIGRVTAEKLAIQGATVILACRDDQRGLGAAAEINNTLKTLPPNEYPYCSKGKAQYMRLDLSDLHSIVDFCSRFRDLYKRLDVLVNNAGLNTDVLLQNGIQQLFQVNYLGHYLLVRYLLDLMVCTDSGPKAARVINLSSVTHHQGQANFKLSALRLFSSSMRSQFSYYADSKFYMNLLTMELNHRFSDHAKVQTSIDHIIHSTHGVRKWYVNRPTRPLIAVSVNPGAVQSEIWRSMPLRSLFLSVSKHVFLSTDQGSNCSVYAATVPESTLRNYMLSHDWSERNVGTLCMRGDIPYVTPYAMPFPLLAFEMLGTYAGPRFSGISIPKSSVDSRHKGEIARVTDRGDKQFNVDFGSPRELALLLWQFSAECCHRVLLQSGVTHEEVDFLVAASI